MDNGRLFGNGAAQVNSVPLPEKVPPIARRAEEHEETDPIETDKKRKFEKIPSYVQHRRDGNTASSRAPPSRIINGFGFGKRGTSSVLSIPEGSAASTRPKLSKMRSQFIESSKDLQLSVLPMSGYAQSSSRRLLDAKPPDDNVWHRRLIAAVPELQMGILRKDSSESLRSDEAVDLAPTRLMDIEKGSSIPLSDLNFLPRTRYEVTNRPDTVSTTVTPFAKENDVFFVEHGVSLEDRIRKGDVREFETNNEVGVLGGAWRGALRRLLVWSYDSVNALRLTRALQPFLPFLTGYEAYVMDQLIEALGNGRKHDIQHVLTVAFQNRNVSRILVQQIGPRYDFLWHWSTMVTWNRIFDAWGQLPIVGITSFPATENFPSTRDHALASIFRIVLGEGNWLTRVVTQGREGIVTNDPNNAAQNLTAESNGFELANRNQYGTYFGRLKTNEFRFSHRLPTDESIVRTFVTQPMPTMLNNGVVHVLRQLAKHWHNMLRQQNFAHQRMEQLDPFETLRFHMPVVLLTLSSLRGRNRWDSVVLGPVIRELQGLKPGFTADAARNLVRRLRNTIAMDVCGGVTTLLGPLMAWLEAIEMACKGIEEEAKDVYDILASVEVGIRLGHDLITQVSWKIPNEETLKEAIVNHIHGLTTSNVDESSIRSAVTKIASRDMRTLFELVKAGLGESRPAQLLLGRTKTLLERELRRKALNEGIRELSVGPVLSEADLQHDEWYWLEEDGRADVYTYDSKITGRYQYRFIGVVSQTERLESFSSDQVTLKGYIPVAEAISRAQRAFMNIELDHGKRYSYNAFMEFSYLRTALRRLVVISEVTCEELDKARLNVLAEIQRSNQMEVLVSELQVGNQYFSFDSIENEYVPFSFQRQYTQSDRDWRSLSINKIVKAPPQSVIVIGGGPTGLITGIHSLESVLASGGDMKLYEARDAFARGGATFERAQIVRLDARWIAMLRYHLGTGFEDAYIPASGETDAQLGNTLASQGFVEITIKDLENMLHEEVSKLWSKGLIKVHTDSQTKFDHNSNALTKLGEHLKLGDRILRRVDENGRLSNRQRSWEIVDLIYVQPLNISEVKVGQEYGIYMRAEEAVIPFKLVSVDIESSFYSFKAVDDDQDDLEATALQLPSIYPGGMSRHLEVDKVVFQCVKAGSKKTHVRTSMPMKLIRTQKFTMDVGHSHVVEAIGKPHGSNVHFRVTTYEPYGVCCIQGLKISMGMHNFGEKRWGSGLLDDIRSQNDQNTRIVGDFTKMVRSAPVAKKMLEYMTDSKDTNWQTHFLTLVEESGFPELNEFDPVLPKIVAACVEFEKAAPSFKRQTLQTRFFETGDNYYLGMELTREFDTWKNELASELVGPLSLKAKTEEVKTRVNKLKSTLLHHIDRLWYEGVLEVIRTGDVYNPGARHRVPRLYLINSHSEVEIGSLPVGESFRLTGSSDDLFEIVIKRGSQIIVRNFEGFISEMSLSTMVRREGNLTRSPDGNKESKVSLATFPVAHHVNFRTMRLNDSDKGYVFAFVSDEQATPHFMRYSGLTGACVNAMLFNNFVKQAIEGVPFIDRYRSYSVETDWSNGEVVQRGTGSNYGLDGFLRPGFPYENGVDYLHSKVTECCETEQDLDDILSHDWKVKIAASIVPRGMELNETFVDALYQQLQSMIFDKFVNEATMGNKHRSESLEIALKARARAMMTERAKLDCQSYWRDFVLGLRLDEETKEALEKGAVSTAIRLEQICNDVIDFAKKSYLYNERVSSELFNQPKPVDSIVDDFAVEAQNFANALTMSAAFASGVLAFRLVGDRAAGIASALLAVFNILISFGTMTNSARYKIRNEEARVEIADEELPRVMKGMFGLMDRESQDALPIEKNPFVIDLERAVDIFLKNAAYYDEPEPTEFKDSYAKLKENINDPVAIQVFQRLLTTKFIVKTYHVNSYLQEYLVTIYKILEEMYEMLTEEVDGTVGGEEAHRLFDRLLAFRPRLEGTLQRGSTRYGFVKQRKLSDWDIVVLFKYAWILMWCTNSTRAVALAPISTETLGIVKQTKRLASRGMPHILCREIRHLDTLYWATRESDIGSLVFMNAFFVFFASLIFSVARALRVDLLEKFAFWAVAASALGAVLAAFHLWRKLWILLRLAGTLATKARKSRSLDDRKNVRSVLGVTAIQLLLTVMRLMTAGAASVALPWSVAENGYGDRVDSHELLPFWIALGAVGMAIVSMFFFFVVEYMVRYNLSPRLGEFVCESFREEIEELYDMFSRPLNDIDTKQVQERETWEFVAREFLHRYRFDAVFAADRFGNILQYIQGGMDLHK